MRTICVLLFMTVFLTTLRAIPVSGMVLDPDGKPLAGARVLIKQGSGAAWHDLRTDAGGAFSVDLPILDEDTASLAHAYIYAPGLALSGFELLAGANTLRLGAGRRITGRVVDTEQKPVAAAVVRLQEMFSFREDRMDWLIVPDALRAAFSTRTDAEGQWTLADVWAGDATCHVVLDDPRFVVVDMNVEAQATTLLAKPAATITGRVLLPDGKAAAGITVYAKAELNAAEHAQAVTALDGYYRLNSLQTGVVSLEVDDPTGQWVAPARRGVKISEGTVTAQEDFTLTAGVLVYATVTDAQSGVPLSGVSLHCAGPHLVGANPGGGYADTDKEGHCQFRVVPGLATVEMVRVPKGYIQQPFRQLEHQALTVQGEARYAVSFQLSKGERISGVVVDTAGKPLPGLRLRIQAGTELSSAAVEVTVKADAAGKFSTTGLLPGPVLLMQSGNANNPFDVYHVRDEWEVDSPQRVALPQADELTVVMRKSPRFTLTGRVVSTDGKPLAEASIAFTMRTQTFPVMYGPGIKTMSPTDADGRFSEANLLPALDIAMHTAICEGYQYLSGGVVSKEGETFQVSDIVMAPLSARISGRVITPEQAPAVGAMVEEVGAGKRVQVDPTGHFTLSGLPAGKVTLVAARGTAGALLHVQTGDTPVLLSLAAPPIITEPDVPRASAIITEEWHAAAGKGYSARNDLLRTLAGYAPDLALQLALEEQGDAQQKAVKCVIEGLAAIDPAAAAEWAPSRLALVGDAQSRTHAMLSFGMAVADTAPELATELFRQAKAQLAGVDQEQHVSDIANLAALAARLNLPAASALCDEAIAAATTKDGGDNRYWVIITLATGSPTLAEKAAAPFTGLMRIRLLADIAKKCASKDSAVAQHCLAEIAMDTSCVDVVEDNSKAEQYARAVLYVIPAIGKQHPEEALALANTVGDWRYRSRALALAAIFQPRQVALRLLREAAGAFSLRDQARIARMAYSIEASTGKELYQTSREHLAARKDNGGFAEDRIACLFYGSSIDPVDTRLSLESEFARRQTEGVTLAMATLDVERGLAMARAIPNGETRMHALLAIAQYVLTPAVNQIWPYERWIDNGTDIIAGDGQPGHP